MSGDERAAAARELIGVYVTLTAPHHAARHGVLLPPAGRGSLLRLADDDGAVRRLNPGSWTIAPHASLPLDKHGRPLAAASRFSGLPTYRYTDLPAQHLATKTMLRREHRRQPAPGQVPLAYYDAKELWAPLYAVVDTVQLPPLSQNRSQLFALARTCCVCGDVFPRPLQKSPEGDRYCEPCHLAAVGPRWIEQVRPVQAEMADWAASAVADPTTVIAHVQDEGSASMLHVETCGGEVVLRVRLRSFIDLADAKDPERYADTVHASEILPQLNDLAARRIITWSGFYCYALPAFDREHNRVTPGLASGVDDQVEQRHSLWTARAPHSRYGFWYQEPKLPWRCGGMDPGIYSLKQDVAAIVATIRGYLLAMATGPAPQPATPEAGR